MIISQPKTSFLGVVFDGDHDFEGPRAPKAHLGTVNTNLTHHLSRPRITTLAVLLQSCPTLAQVPPGGGLLLLGFALFKSPRSTPPLLERSVGLLKKSNAPRTLTVEVLPRQAV